MNTILRNIILEPYCQRIGQLLVAQNKNILQLLYLTFSVRTQTRNNRTEAAAKITTNKHNTSGARE